MSRRRRVFVNEAFRPQRVSGQQRYAGEIADRLPQQFIRVRPGAFWSSSSLRTWFWTLMVLPWRSRRGVLISMTARAPLWHPRHVLVVHDLFAIEHPEWFSRAYHLTHAPLLRFQLRTAAVLVAVSEPVADEVRRIRPQLAVPVAPNAPSAVFDAPSDSDSARVRRRGLEPGGYLVVVGSLDPRKNLARLASAYARIDERSRSSCPLVVVGGDAGVFRRASIRWPPETVLAGYVDDDDLRALYAGSAAVVFPSLAEGFGLPIVEAVASGATRLVLSELPVFRWIAGDAAGYIDPLSERSIESGLLAGMAGRLPSADPLIPARFDWVASAEVVATAAAEVV